MKPTVKPEGAAAGAALADALAPLVGDDLLHAMETSPTRKRSADRAATRAPCGGDLRMHVLVAGGSFPQHVRFDSDALKRARDATQARSSTLAVRAAATSVSMAEDFRRESRSTLSVNIAHRMVRERRGNRRCPIPTALF